MKRKLKFGLSAAKESAPLWMQHTLSVLVILFLSKGFIINEMPIDNVTVKETVGSWISYGLGLTEVTLAIVMVFVAPQKDKPDTDKPM